MLTTCGQSARGHGRRWAAMGGGVGTAITSAAQGRAAVCVQPWPERPWWHAHVWCAGHLRGEEADGVDRVAHVLHRAPREALG